MPDEKQNQFLRDLDRKLWTAADRLRSDLDAAVYKHAVLGLIFLKYVSDSFEIRQREVNMKEWWNAKLEGDPRWMHGHRLEKAIRDNLASIGFALPEVAREPCLIRTGKRAITIKCNGTRDCGFPETVILFTAYPAILAVRLQKKHPGPGLERSNCFAIGIRHATSRVYFA